MGMKLTFAFCFGAILGIIVDCKQTEDFLREGYSYIGSGNAVYKFHSVKKSWVGAKTQCEQEGATLFYPENEQEAKQVRGFYDQPEAEWIIGISDLRTEGEFKTVDGRDIDAVYNKWDSGEPNNEDDKEDCVILRKQSLLNDVPCDLQYTFACKKVLKDLSVNQEHDIANASHLLVGALERLATSQTATLGRLAEAITNQATASDRIAAAIAAQTQTLQQQAASQTAAIQHLTDNIGVQAANQTATIAQLARAVEQLIEDSNQLDIRSHPIT